jgi:gliding motility-associated-like protein
MNIIKFTTTIIFGILLFANQLIGQTIQVTPATTPPFTPTNLLQQVFLGDGVEVLNISYSGSNNAIGYFKLGTQDIGIYDGVVMSSGNVGSVPTASNVSGGTSGTMTNNMDADLSAVIAPSTSRDAAVYTIDFIPSSDTLSFNFVFASEEYPEFVCSFNDAFGFFLSGPGITGPYTNMAKNIALVPNSTTPILVGTVNNGSSVGNLQPCITTNSQYYVDNVNVPAPGQSQYAFEFDGFTTVMTAQAVVIPCNTYRIKLAVADANDQVYDTAVFLEANSFGTNGLRAFTETPSLTNSIAEGCTAGIINFELDEPADGAHVINYTLGGNAIMGIDYDTIPLFATIPNGQTSTQVPIQAIIDNVIEGTDTIEIIVNITPCVQDTFLVFIDDAILEIPSVIDSTICLGDSVSLDATIGTAIPAGFSFLNDTVKIVDVQFPPNPSDATYIDVTGVPMNNVQSGTIESVCVNIDALWPGDIDLYLISPSGQFLELSTDNGGGIHPQLTNAYTQTCFTPTATQDILGLISTDVPFTGDYQPEGDWSDLYGSPVNGTWKLQIIDDGVGFADTLRDWSISFAPAYGYNYQWVATDSISATDAPIVTTYPDSTTDYIINVIDDYGCIFSDTSTITVGYTLDAPIASCDTVSTNTIGINWSTVDDATGYQVSINGAGFNPVAAGDTSLITTGFPPNQTVTFEVQAIGSFCPPNGIDTISCVTQPCSLAATLVSTVNVTCSGQTDGSATFTAINGTGDYNYSLNGGAPQVNNGVFNNLTNGGYQVIVSDGDACADTINFTITAPAGVVTTISSTITSCFGGNDGTATVNGTGGTPGYLYAWSSMPVQTTPIATGLTAGDYYVTVTDANNCFVIDTVTVGQPNAVTSTMASTIVSCFGGNDGTATVSPSGGTPGYIYSWNTTPVQTTQIATGLSIGTYIVIITDANNCTVQDTVTITQESQMSASSTSTLVSCSGGTDGTATVTGAGGVGSYTYNWNTTPFQTTQTAVNLSATTYFVTVTDANNCTVIDTVTVSTNNPIILTSSSVNAACMGISDGNATVIANGGAGGFTYQWDANAANQTTANAANLGFGSYHVTVTDANSCFDTITVSVGINTTLTSAMSSTDASCFNGNDGTATIIPGNGVAPYNYTWSAVGAPNAANINTLSAATYYVTATDVNGCFVSDSVLVDEPMDVITTIGYTGVSCNSGNDGSATVSAVGGTTPYNYAWNTTPSQTTATASNLTAGQYIVTVTDANSCSYDDTIVVTEPTALSVIMNKRDVNCHGTNDGKSWVTVSGGTAPYNYAWNSSPPSVTDTLFNAFAGIYIVTVTDANNCTITGTVTITEPAAPLTSGVLHSDLSCNGGSDGTATAIPVGGTPPYSYNWSNSMTGGNINGLTAGTYLVSITDNNGCITLDSATLTEPTAIALVLDQTSATCNDGTDGMATVIASGGTPDSLGNYSFAWNSTPSQSGDTATNLTGDITYLVVVTDNNGCAQSDTITIGNPEPVELTTAITDTDCFGNDSGVAEVTATGGTMPYSYQWSANANGQTTASASGLGVGTYTVTVTDINGCFNIASATIVQPNQMSVTSNTFDVLCKGDATGIANITVAGGTPTYIYQWDNAAGNATTTTVSNLLAGTYYVSVTDSSSCTLVDSITISEPATALAATIRTGNVTCFGDRDGQIIVTASGGTPGYEYSFDDSLYNATSHLAGLYPGSYTVYIKDANACKYQIDSIIITEPLEMTVDLGPDLNIVLSEDTTLMPMIMNGVPPYMFAWTPQDSAISCADCEEPDIIGLQTPQHYYLQVTDASGCQAIDDIFIDVATPRVVYIATGFTPNNDGVNDWLFVQGDHNAVKVTDFKVYDRWGELVFLNKDFGLNDPNTGWDGTFKGDNAGSGVYGWVIEVEFSDGIKKIYKGNTSLIR